MSFRRRCRAAARRRCRDDAHVMDALTVVLLLTGGVCTGSYSVLIKAPRVVKSGVDSLDVLCYKSAAALLFAILCAAFGAHPVRFTWWGAGSAAAYLPGGLGAIVSYWLVGIAPTALLISGTSTVVSFVVFTLAFGEPVRAHTLPGGGTFYLAPVWIVGTVLGMTALVLIPHMCAKDRAAEATTSSARIESLLEAARSDEAGEAAPKKRARFGASLTQSAILGYAISVVAGVCVATHYGVLFAAKKVASPELLEPVGPWFFSFGVSVFIGTLAIVVVRAVYRAIRSRCQTDADDKAAPRATCGEKLRATFVPCSGAGLLWAVGSLTTTCAIQRGGPAILMAQHHAITLITASMWGVLYYREVWGRAAVAWAAAALWTVGMVVLLAWEKE